MIPVEERVGPWELHLVPGCFLPSYFSFFSLSVLFWCHEATSFPLPCPSATMFLPFHRANSKRSQPDNRGLRLLKLWAEINLNGRLTLDMTFPTPKLSASTCIVLSSMAVPLANTGCCKRDKREHKIFQLTEDIWRHPNIYTKGHCPLRHKTSRNSNHFPD